MDEKVKIAVIGCGDVAYHGHFPSFKRQPRINVDAVCDSDPDKMRRAQKLFPESVAYSDAIKAMEHPGLSAVFILTPPTATPYLVLEALKRNIPVFCEKPMALSEHLAEQIMEREREAQVPVQVGMKNIFNPLMEALRDRIRSGWLGAPLVYRISVFDEAYDPANAEHTGRIVAALKEGSPLLHEGAHVFDWLRWFSGASEPVSVIAKGMRSIPEWPRHNFVAATIAFENGNLALVDAGWMYPSFFPGSIEVLGPDGVARLSRSEGRVIFRRLETEETVVLERDWNSVCFDNQLSHFLSCLDKRCTPSPGTKEALYGIRIMTAIEKALMEG